MKGSHASPPCVTGAGWEAPGQLCSSHSPSSRGETQRRHRPGTPCLPVPGAVKPVRLVIVGTVDVPAGLNGPQQSRASLQALLGSQALPEGWSFPGLVFSRSSPCLSESRTGHSFYPHQESWPGLGFPSRQRGFTAAELITLWHSIEPHPVATSSLWLWVMFCFYHIHFHPALLKYIPCARHCAGSWRCRGSHSGCEGASTLAGEAPSHQKTAALYARPPSAATLGAHCPVGAMLRGYLTSLHFDGLVCHERGTAGLGTVPDTE